MEKGGFDDVDQDDPTHEKYLLYKILNLERGADTAAIVSFSHLAKKIQASYY